MNAHRAIYKVFSLALVLCLGAPQSALALRVPNAKDSPPLERAIAAGMEEPAVSLEDRIRKELDALQVEIERQLKVSIPRSTHSPKNQMVTFADAFLNYPAPLYVKVKVQELMRRVDLRVLDPLLQAAAGRFSPGMEELRELALILPVSDDWLVAAYSAYEGDEHKFKNRTIALATYSVRSTLLGHGRNGHHLRAEFDELDFPDVNNAHILMGKGFFSELKKRLLEVHQLHAGGRSEGDLRRKAREYAGALFNGLTIPEPASSSTPLAHYRGFFRYWMDTLKKKGEEDPEAVIKLAADAFPDQFPSDPKGMPDFLRFSNQVFAWREIGQIREFNRHYDGQPLTLWQLTSGTGATDDYIQYLIRKGEKPLSRHRELLEQVYGYVLQQAGVIPALSPATEGLRAGMEESGGSLEKRIGGELNSLAVRAQQSFGTGPGLLFKNYGNPPMGRLAHLMEVLLDLPDPSAARGKVRGLL